MRKKPGGSPLQRDLEQLFRRSNILTEAHKKALIEYMGVRQDKSGQLTLPTPNS